MHHRSDLPCKKTAVLHIAVLHRAAQRAHAELLELIIRHCAIFRLGIVARKRRAQAAHRVPQSLARDHGGQIACFEYFFFIRWMNIAFRCTQEPRAHLHTTRAQHERRCKSASVRNAACRNHRQRGSIAHQRNQHHRGQLPHMAAAFAALGDHR